MSYKTCQKCGTSGLRWNQIYHQITGKWRLENHKGCSLNQKFAGLVIAPFAADPTNDAYLANAPDL